MSGKGDMSQKLLGATTNTFQHVLLDHTAAKTIKVVSCYIQKKYLRTCYEEQYWNEYLEY